MDATGITPQGTGHDITAQWVWDYFRDVDTLDPEQVVKHYPEHGSFRFANQAPAVGKDAIRQLLVQFYGAVQDMKHRNTGLWLGDNTAVFEAEVTFVRRDGARVVVPASSIIRREGELVTDFRMVMDAAPVTAPSA